MLHPFQHVPPTQHLLAQLHQIRHTVFPITDEFLQLERYEGDGFGAVQLEASGESCLGEAAKVGKEELVL
jgi:hypothetical protein